MPDGLDVSLLKIAFPLWCEGKNTAEIAKRMGALPEHVVANQLGRLFDKMYRQAKTKAEVLAQMKQGAA
jgi:DNA-binding CsgD family transcriptional regulator